MITSFAPNPNAQVRTITASPDGSRIYVGGDFTSIAGATRSRIAAFTTANSALVGNFTPSVGYHVYDISVRGNGTAARCTSGATSRNVGSQYRGRLAAFNSTGTLLSWAPDASDREVWAVQVSPDGSQVAVAGQFETLNGTSDFGRGLAVVDAVTGAIEPFAATGLVRNGGVDGGITELFTDGDLLYGSGYTFGRDAGTLEGIFAAQWGDGDGPSGSTTATATPTRCSLKVTSCTRPGMRTTAATSTGSCSRGTGRIWDWYRGVAHSKQVAGTDLDRAPGLHELRRPAPPGPAELVPGTQCGHVHRTRAGPLGRHGRQPLHRDGG